MRYLIKILLILSMLPYVPEAAANNVKFYSTGSYVDRSNAAHTWSINEHHTLIWNGHPYIPVGGVFYSRYIAEGRTEANWEEDVKALELLKRKGIVDLLLKNVGPVSWVSAEAWQRLIDYLDTNDFTYGLDLSDNPKGVLAGHIVRPHRYRLPVVMNDGSYAFNIQDAVSAFYVLAHPTDASVVRSGNAEVADGKVTVKVKAGLGNEYVLVLYPEVDISGHGDGGIPNLWDGYDAFRDKLLAFLEKIKFGKGLRFFLDPFDVRMSLVGNLATAVPNSPGFMIEFEAWLRKKYPLPANVAESWGMVVQDVRSMQEIARLLPLWHAGKGVARAYDRTTGELKKVMVQNSAMWDDIIEFRDSSIRSYMNAIADVLKTRIADVPVVFRMGDYYRVYANRQTKGGFDGLAVDAYGRGESLVADRLGPAYSLAEESAKTMWTIVSSVQNTGPGFQKSSPGFESKTAMTGDLDLLQNGGTKGIFVLALQMSPKVVSKNFELVQTPEQLDWLAEFKNDISGTEVFSPKVIYFPSATVSGAVSKRLDIGTWWLPSLKAARTFSMGYNILGYSFVGENVSYVWSLTGPAVTTLKLQKGQEPLIVYPNPPGERAVIEKGRLTLKLDSGPLGVRGIGQNQLFPLEVVEVEIEKLERLIPVAEKAGTKVIVAKDALGDSKKVLKNGSAFTAYDMAHTAVLNLQAALTSYAWLEGESTISQNFDRIAGGIGTSFGRYLSLDTDDDAPMVPYGATYSLVVPKDGDYEIWLAGYIPGDTGSPAAYSVDGGEWIEIADAKATGPTYGPGFAWTRIGRTKLAKGPHTFALKVTGRRKSDNRYVMAVDAILLTSEPFVPSGTTRP